MRDRTAGDRFVDWLRHQDGECRPSCAYCRDADDTEAEDDGRDRQPEPCPWEMWTDHGGEGGA